MLTLLLASYAGAVAQRAPTTIPRVTPSFFSTYTYLSYSIQDKATSAEPMAAQGVGGTLTLRPDGTYQKRLKLAANGGTMSFDQDGRFTFTGDRITFSYTDKKGQPRTDQGTFRLQPAARLLTLTLIGYPAGNTGIYTLRVQ
ncbi:hypothetical protein HMJ29_14210 [Hymenobacter taeanensis]|uniref:Lipocalin-like domain-containing protein n=1 Tax=Hymenobacter taeanensis TaxID=2735321 RepID=A0A6M6BJ66_9BACT|nr:MULTISPECIES: hypothetical protein [Hymenobacter]QJX48029.1 hypothetical protein HMJ29_14210 [Hymenobacter taeanensis]UOQ82523.1 copper resistance protein NlpE [Hymenobacter sp. 5414T-23]